MSPAGYCRPSRALLRKQLYYYCEDLSDRGLSQWAHHQHPSVVSHRSESPQVSIQQLTLSHNKPEQQVHRTWHYSTNPLNDSSKQRLRTTQWPRRGIVCIVLYRLTTRSTLWLQFCYCYQSLTRFLIKQLAFRTHAMMARSLSSAVHLLEGSSD